MASRLTADDVEAIASVLDAWPAGTALTWKALLRRCEKQHGIFSTRQTFSRHPAIKLAFQTRKAALRDERPPRSSESFLKSQVRTLRAENARLRNENERFSAMFARWQYNACKRGLRKHQLDEPMPRTDRRRSVSPL